MRRLINCLQTIYPLSLLALLLISAEAKATDYDLWVAGVQVTSENENDVLGDGTVSYDAETNTLTLNNATIEPEEEFAETPGIVYSNNEDLTIALIGNNSVKGSDGCSAISHYGEEMPNLSFARVGNQHFSLDLIAQTGDFNDFIDGFEETNIGDFFVFDNNDDGTYTKTISSSILGGTGSEDEPFLIKTATDLKAFADYFNNEVIGTDVYVQLYNNIICGDLEDFEPIGDYNNSFAGTFDGNHKTISNLTATDITGEGVGLFRYLATNGTIQNLTLDNFTLSGGNSSSNKIGAIVGVMDGGTINNCQLLNSNISCMSDSQVPTVGGIVGQMSAGSITDCIVQNSAINAQTSDEWASGAVANAGGIAGDFIDGTISGCQVKGTTTVLADYSLMGTAAAGAIAGRLVEGSQTLSNNYYEYTVTTQYKSVGDNAFTTETEYTPRGIGGTSYNSETEEYDRIPDVTTDNGAVMYAKAVTVGGEHCDIEDDESYSPLTDDANHIYYFAPGQTAALRVSPAEGYTIASLTATNSTASATISTESEDLGDNVTLYTFEMPDAPVAVTVTTAQTMGIRVAGVEITEMNVDDVMGDGKVSYDVATNTLTLNGATVNGCIYNESMNSLTVHLLGENVIDGGYVSDDQNGDWAFGTDVSNARLYITTDEENPGQLLIKNSYRNEWENPEYYEGWYPQLKNGLTESQNNGDMKAFIATAPVVTPGEGLYWPDQQYEVSTLLEGSVYYQDGMGHISKTAYEAPFTMTTAGKYNLNVWQEVTVDETDFSLNASGSLYIVHNKPGFSVEEGTYNEEQAIKLTNLPTLPQNSNNYPQVWYYLNDNENDSIQYTSAEQEIALTESAKVCVYILDEDSSKVVKSAPVEAEYTIQSKTELNISYAQNSREWATYYADEQSLETPAGLQAYVVTGIQEDGVVVSEISYIPQGVGVLLRRTENVTEPIMAKAYMEDGPQTEMPDNLLEGTAENMAVSSVSSDVYVLYDDNFVRTTSGTIPAGRCYLPVGTDVGAGSRLAIRLGSETTAVSFVKNDKMKSERIYDLQGRRTQRSTFNAQRSTLMIINGKKIMK